MLAVFVGFLSNVDFWACHNLTFVANQRYNFAHGFAHGFCFILKYMSVSLLGYNMSL